MDKDTRVEWFRGARSRGFLTILVLTLALPVLGSGAMLARAQTSTEPATATSSEECPPATPTSGSTAPEHCVVLGEYDIYYKPNLATIPAESAVRVVLVNHGETTHNFSITDHGNSGLENLNISVTGEAGETTETTIDAPEGTYYFFCDQPGHEAAGMRGYLTVEQDAEITTSEATVTPRAG